MWNIIFHSLLVLHWWPYTKLAILVCGAEELGHTLSSGQGLPRGLWLMAHPARHFPSSTTQDHTPSNGLALLSQALADT